MRLQRQGRATPVQAVYSGWGGGRYVFASSSKHRSFGVTDRP